MPYIDKKYDQLYLMDSYLADPLLLALAWKKSHEYIRTINWYADNFELDKSALNLYNLCNEWEQELNDEVRFSPIDLVPAPKTAKWDFVKNNCPNAFEILDLTFDEIEDPCYCLKWEPSDAKSIKLRPLAHVGIKEQTFMTLIMMCLATDVESVQGDPATDYENVHEKNIVSYGNRLYCRYHEDGKAEHDYGATTIYGKYFKDYRRFLQRPYYFAARALPEKSPDEEIYLVELDIRQFFDRVNRDLLVEKIVSISQSTPILGRNSSRIVNNLFKEFVGWEWTEGAKERYQVCKSDYVQLPPKGLPQGLVASGFLSNIYMLEFDSFVSNHIGRTIKNDALGYEIKIVDYCRYVDDMRLVIVGPSRAKNGGKNPIPEMGNSINKFFEAELEKLNLELNNNKLKIEIYRGKSVGISATLESIQGRTSGPVSYEDAGELLGQLESLLMLSVNDRELDAQVGDCRINSLALIEKDIFDVREDTLKRFAANKMSRMLSDIRHFTSRNADADGIPVPGEWDYLQERIARRMVAGWTYDPSLLMLLKKGLELFPSPKLLRPVLEQLEHALDKLTLNNDVLRKQGAVAKYCLAEIFRHSAIVIHRKDPQSIPAQADVDGYFDLVQDLAARLVYKGIPQEAQVNESDADRRSESGGFDLLLDQARFLLMTRLDTVLEKSSGNDDQDMIFKLAKGFRKIAVKYPEDSDRMAICILIASQLSTDQKLVVRATSCLLDCDGVDVKHVLEKIAIQNSMLVKSLILHARPLQYAWYKNGRNSFVKEISDIVYLAVKPSAKPLAEIKEPISIYKLSSRFDNPFSNEIMALKLMLGMIDKSNNFIPDHSDKIIDLSRTKIELKGGGEAVGYTIPTAYEVFDLNVSVVDDICFHKPLSGLALHFIDVPSDASVLQKIALATRAVLSGAADPTGFSQSSTPGAGYRGIKSTSYKRQLGMMTTPESLAGENAQFSGWLTTLLAKLLRWPGIHVNDQGFNWPTELTLDVVKKIIETRLVFLKENYCQLSKTPGLTELIIPSWADTKRCLTVAMVQSKLPFKNDFAKAGLLLDDAQYRVKHRRHVARIAQLVIKHIEAQSVEALSGGKREQDIDLIVLPELAVHRDDIDILIHLSRKTKAIIFSGISFINQSNIKGPNNCAVWIVPRKHAGNSNEIIRYQGKYHMMEGERALNVQPWRPYQLMLELRHSAFKDKRGFVLTGAICFDATDISLSADLRDKSSAFIVSALNQDVGSFDTMVEALHYHMYQPVVLVNTGEFGGSYAMAPYKEQHKRLIAHATGNNQVSISTFEMNMFDFRRDGLGKSFLSGNETKTPPAGVPHK